MPKKQRRVREPFMAQGTKGLLPLPLVQGMGQRGADVHEGGIFVKHGEGIAQWATRGLYTVVFDVLCL